MFCFHFLTLRVKKKKTVGRGDKAYLLKNIQKKTINYLLINIINFYFDEKRSILISKKKNSILASTILKFKNILLSIK